MKRLLASLLLVLLSASPTLADGVGPQRKMTAAEASAFERVSSTIQSALPKVPEGYKFTFEYVSDCTDGMLPEAIKSEQMFRMLFVATYTLDRDLRAQAQTNPFMERAKGTPEQQAKLAVLDAKDAELTKARNQTRDRAERDKIRAELKGVQEEENKLREDIMTQYQAWLASGGAETASKELAKSLATEELTLRILLNDDVSLNHKASPIKVDGAPLAFEQSEGCEDYDTYCITVFLGPFTKTPFISDHWRYKLQEAAGDVPTKARGLALTVSGPKDKAESVRAFLQQTDLAKLKSLLP